MNVSPDVILGTIVTLAGAIATGTVRIIIGLTRLETLLRTHIRDPHAHDPH